jgi:hypothetical protein
MIVVSLRLDCNIISVSNYLVLFFFSFLVFSCECQWVLIGG